MSADRPDKDGENFEPWPVGGRNAWGSPKIVATIKLDVYDIVFIVLILAAGAWSHAHFMP